MGDSDDHRDIGDGDGDDVRIKTKPCNVHSVQCVPSVFWMSALPFHLVSVKPGLDPEAQTSQHSAATMEWSASCERSGSVAERQV